jgi:cytochrome c
MDNFEVTKIVGSVLAALLLIFGAKEIIASRSVNTAAKPGYTLPGGEAPAAQAAAPAEKKTAEVAKDAAAPAKTDPAAPAAAKPEAAPAKDAAAPVAAKPEATPAKDAAAPVAAPTAAAAGGAGAATVALLSKASADNGKAIYSKCKSCHIAEKGKASTVGPNLWGVVNRPKGAYEGFKYSEGMKAKGGNWSFEDLAGFLENPKGYVQGTKMVFNGLADATERADVIAYLATLADTPVALPK